MLLKEQFVTNQTVTVKYWLLGRDSCVKKFSDLTSRCSLHRGVDLKYKELNEFSLNIKIILEYHYRA